MSPKEPKPSPEFDQFTDTQLDTWFADHVDGTRKFDSARAAILKQGTYGVSDDFEQLDSDFVYGFGVLLENEAIVPFVSPGSPSIDWSFQFSHLSRELKLKILHGWVRQNSRKPLLPKAPTDPQWPDPELTRLSITLPDGTTMVDSAESNPDYIPTDYELAPEPKSSLPFGLSKWKVLIGIGGTLGIILAVGIFLTAGESSDTTEVESSDAAEADSSGTLAPASTAPIAGANPCGAVRDQELILELTSPDVQPIIPISFGSGSTDFLAPSFNWSPVPEETTEIAILVLRLDDERAALYTEDPLLWWGGSSIGGGGVPIGRAKWLVTGIDPLATGLAQSSQTIPLPEGAIERSTPGGGYAQYGALEGDFMYRGTGTPGVKHLFTVFALCNPTVDFVDDPGAGWLRRFSIATGWFISESG